MIMLILNADEVRKALPMKETIEAMKQAYASLSDGKADVPLRTRIDIPPQEAISLFMPAYVQVEGDDALAIKVVSLFPFPKQPGARTQPGFYTSRCTRA